LSRQFFWIVSLVTLSCNNLNEAESAFEVRTATETGLTFTNELTPRSDFNMFTYMYFYNGAGIGAGDFNKDGRIDLFFAANQQQNKLFLNEGNLHFKDITQQAHIPNDSGWHTGVSVVDVNQDGWLDIYICKVSNFEKLTGHNELLICKGITPDSIPVFEESAKKFGLDFRGFSTQAAFFDYDLDGDLDCYLLNHSVHQNGTFAKRALFNNTFHPESGDRLYRNLWMEHDSVFFKDETKASGILSTAIGYGLGICISDINADGWPDIYVGNDFHENDYLYINNKNGSFTESGQQAFMHTSQYTMGVDIADANNDAYPEVISMDMLPADAYILKRSLGEDPYDLYYQKIGYGYGYQYTRNNLQFNNRNGTFSEIGLYSGVASTDWSWATLWMDFDNDGFKDIFVSNGIPKRLNDIDYVNFVANDTIQVKIRQDRVEEKYLALTGKYPEIKIPNYFFHNNGDLLFEDWHALVKGSAPTFSNGSVYADFDNDGDLDIVTNNIADPATLYENKTNNDSCLSVQFMLHGTEENHFSVGSRVLAFKKGQLLWYEKTAVRGFMSSMEIPLHAGFGASMPDSIYLIWPDNTFEKLEINQKGLQHITHKKGLATFDYALIKQFQPTQAPSATDIAVSAGLGFSHEEDLFNEFNREGLLPRMLTTQGPAAAVGDINNDGYDDLYIGGAKWGKRALFVQDTYGKFKELITPALKQDSNYEDIDAVFTDIDNDGRSDLLVASGGNEFPLNSKETQPRIYKNTGKGFVRMQSYLDSVHINASCIVPFDFNKDGYTDIFIGGRSVPWNYGELPTSYLLQNSGGHFTVVTEKVCKDLSSVGMVTGAKADDIDKDGDTDLIISLEWGPILWFENEGKTFRRREITKEFGWWNSVDLIDVNVDGNLDIVCGNLGLNSRLHASPTEPVKMYYADFDNNGKKEQILTYYLAGNEIPFATKDELQKQMPTLKKKFLYAEDFAKASLSDLVDPSALAGAKQFHADYFQNAVLINEGTNKFRLAALPWQNQLSAIFCAVGITDTVNHKTWLLSAGNFYENNIEMGRYDACYGHMTSVGESFKTEPIQSLNITGQARKILPIKVNSKQAFLVVRNNLPVMLLTFR
jgi:hypothetical protein